MALPLPIADRAIGSRPPIHPELKEAADVCRLLGATFVLLSAAPLLPRDFISFWGPVGNGGIDSTGVGRVLGILTTCFSSGRAPGTSSPHG